MAPLLAPLPIIDVMPGAFIALEAIDPTTGAPVAGVAVVDVTIYGDAIEGADLSAPIDSMYLLPTDT